MALSPNTKNLTVNMPDELYKQIKIHCAVNDIKIKDYVIKLIVKDLEKKS